MGLFKSVKKVVKGVAKFAGPIAALSGVGLPLAAAIGGAGGLLSGGGLKGIGLGALGGAAGAAGGSIFGTGGALGTNLTGAGLSAANGALASGLVGAQDGLSGALTSGLTGGLGGYYSAGGFSNGLSGGGQTGSTAFANGSGLGKAGGISLSSPSTTQLTGGISSSYAPVSSASSGFGSYLDKAKDLIGEYGNVISPVASAAIGGVTNTQAAEDLLKQQEKSQALLTPFLNSKFEPGDLTQDAGYQFQLQQGQNALDRAQSARGNYFSGEALQAANDYGQGLASTTYDDAYKRYLSNQQQKLGVAGALTGVYDNIGNINANATTNIGNGVAAGVGGLLGGGFNNQGQSFNTDNALIRALLARQGAYQ